MIAAAAITPCFVPSAISVEPYPYGANGWKLSALNAGSASATKIASAISFTMTSSRLTVALSREPSASSPATASEITIAGTLTIPPAAGPASNASGIGHPAERITPAAYPDQPTATALQTTVYSRMSVHPTIHASSSPSATYVYV